MQNNFEQLNFSELLGEIKKYELLSKAFLIKRINYTVCAFLAGCIAIILYANYMAYPSVFFAKGVICVILLPIFAFQYFRHEEVELDLLRKKLIKSILRKIPYNNINQPRLDLTSYNLYELKEILHAQHEMVA